MKLWKSFGIFNGLHGISFSTLCFGCKKIKLEKRHGYDVKQQFEKHFIEQIREENKK